MLKPIYPVSLKRQQLLAARAHDMRTHAPEPERKLWERLRAGQLGVVFRRQVVLGRYIADFAAPSVNLIVEVNGAAHVRQRAADARRDRDLGRLGYHVVRLPAALVTRDISSAVALVCRALDVRRR
jgi:very-short-patch-repair endonuclease